MEASGIFRFLASAALLALLHGCLEYERENPFDAPRQGGRDAFALAAAADSQGIRIAWNRLAVPGFEKYLLRRSVDPDSSPTAYREFTDPDSVRFFDPRVSPDSLYHYEVALIASGVTSRPSLRVSARPRDDRKARLVLRADTLDFGADRTGLEAVLHNAGQAPLRWSLTLPAEPWLEFTGPAQGTLAPDSSVSLSFGILRDRFPGPGKYSQTVPVLSREGGDRLLVINATIPDPSPPAKPALVLSSRGASTLGLRWSRSPDGDFAAYRLFRGDDDKVDGGDSLIFSSAAVVDTVFTDTGLASLRTYYYRLYVIDRDSLASASEPLPAETEARNSFRVEVRHALTDSPLAGTSLRWQNGRDSALTDGDGTALFRNLEPGPARVSAFRAGFLGAVAAAAIPARGADSLELRLLPSPSFRPIGTSLTFVDIYEAAHDGVFAYVLERDWQSPRLIVLNAATGEPAASVGLKPACSETLADVGVAGGVVLATCPAERKVIRIMNPAGAAEVEALALPFEPYGLELAAGKAYVAGKAGGDTGVVGVLEPGATGAFALEKAVAIPGFAPEYNSSCTRGPRLAMAGDTAFVINAAAAVGRVAKVDVAGAKVLETVVLPWPQLTDIVLAPGGLAVASQSPAADSVFRLDRSLARLPASAAGGPVRNLDRAGTGSLTGFIPLVFTGGRSRKVAFSGAADGAILGEMELPAAVWSWKGAPDGSSALVTTENGIYITEFR